MMLQSCYAVLQPLYLALSAFTVFLLVFNSKKEVFATWNQVSWPYKGRSKTTTGYMDELYNQAKKIR